MLATFTEDKVTPIDRDMACKVMLYAMDNSTGIQAVALCLAQWALETGRGKAMHNANFGNLKAGDAYEGWYTAFKCNEVLRRGGKDVTVWFAPEGELASKNGPVVGRRYFEPPWHPQTRFRAYPNAWDGALWYIDFLQRPQYQAAWKACLTGNPTAFVHALKAARYFTAPEEPYARSVASLQREYSSVLQGLPHEETPIEDDARLCIVRTTDQWIPVPGYDLGQGWRDEPEVEETLPGKV